MRKLKISIIYNGARSSEIELKEDQGGTLALRQMIRRIARVIRKLGHTVTVVPLSHDLISFQRHLRRIKPDVVFNLYEDVVNGALYEMRVAALVRMLGFPMTGSPALSLGLCHYKYITATLLQGAGIPIAPDTHLLERVTDVDKYKWQFPLIVQPAQEHGGMGLERDSVVYTKKALKEKVRHILKNYYQPALAGKFLKGREFNVGIIGGRKLRILPISEVDYSELPENIPPIMSYAAKYLETSVEYKKTSVVCPSKADPELIKQISIIAMRSFRAVSGWGYGRVDIRLDENGTPCVLDVNCNPAIEEEVALARSAKMAGITYPRLLQMIINTALEGPPFDMDVPMLSPVVPSARHLDNLPV